MPGCRALSLPFSPFERSSSVAAQVEQLLVFDDSEPCLMQPALSAKDTSPDLFLLVEISHQLKVYTLDAQIDIVAISDQRAVDGAEGHLLSGRYVEA